MASYSINLVNDGAGVFTPTVRRNPTAATGGTALTFPYLENNLSGTNTSTQLLGTAIYILFSQAANTLSSTLDSQVQSFYLNIIDDGSQNYSVSANYGGTAASGGTVLTIPHVTNTLSGASTFSDNWASLMRACTCAILNSASTTGV